MRSFFLLAAVLAVAQAAEPERWLLEVNFGDYHVRGVMFGASLVIEDGLEASPARMRKLTTLERQWCRVHIKDVDVDCTLEDPLAVDIDLWPGKRTLLLFNKSAGRHGDEIEYVGVAYMYDNGKLTRGGFTRRTPGWDKARNWPDRYLKPDTGCPECDIVIKDLQEGL